MRLSIRSFVLQRGVWSTPESHITPRTKKTARRQEMTRLADTVRGSMLERFDAIVYSGAVAAVLRDLQEHLVGSGWTGHEIITVLREQLFPEMMAAPPGWKPVVRPVGMVPKRGGGGASIERLQAFIKQITPKATPNTGQTPTIQA